MTRALTIAALLGSALVACSNGPHYSSCKEAQEAGVSLPLTRESPGWNPKLDRDGDGEAC